MPMEIHRELSEAGRKINLWQAELRAVLWAAGLGAALWLLSLSDCIARYPFGGRIAAWSVLLALGMGGVVHIVATLRRRRTSCGTAAMLERAFPHLDNRLINYVQFDAEPQRSPLQRAYLERGVPEWRTVDLKAMRDPRVYRRACLAALAAGVLMLAPVVWFGRAWPNAVLRIVNPFSHRMPPTLATLLGVQPGDAEVVQGSPVVISCRVVGRRGQKIELDLWPADDKNSTVLLGTVAASGPAEFSYPIARLTADLVYRIRAGDAIPSSKYAIRAVPPLALEALHVTIVPPAYTRFAPAEANGLTDRIAVPEHSRVECRLRCNRPLAKAFLGVDDEAGTPLESAGGGSWWRGSVVVASGLVCRVSMNDRRGSALTNEIPLEVIPDRPPTIRVLAPTGRAVLVPGAVPGIQFELADDYGLSRAELRRVNRGETDQGEDVLIKAWPLGEPRTISESWTGTAEDVAGETAFRLVGVDNRQPGEPNRSVSAMILFDRASAATVIQEDRQSAEEAAMSVKRLVEMQRSNLRLTVRLDRGGAAAATEQWREVLLSQSRIREVAGQLLENPRQPLGVLNAVVKRAFDGPMIQAVDVLDRLCRLTAADRSPLSRQAVELEAAILRLLSQVDTNLVRVQQGQAATGLLALLEALIKGEEEAIGGTKASVEKKVPPPALLIQRQDALAEDTAEFIRLCRSESEAREGMDPEFPKRAGQAADLAESRKIRAEMLLAAECLEGGRAEDALGPATRALGGLRDIQKILDEWRIQEAAERVEQMKEAIEQSKALIDKMTAVEARVVDSIRATATQKDKSGSDLQELAEENRELKAQMKDVALKIANDLQVLPELPVGNELVEDVTQIYEEMKQIEGSEDSPATELGLQKEDWILNTLKTADKRLDDMEMWLAARPDNVKRNTETFDQQELPKIAMVPMPDHIEDIIGDLLKQQEDIKRQSDDSTGNQGMADLPAGWAIAEGEMTDYAAKGKSGNETPEHKDQDGKSPIGRQGMSDGEVAAASGKINEGDKDIEKRMTRDSSQAGQVSEEGGEAEARATGGGKLSGVSPDKGMSGEGPRRDGLSSTPSELGLQAMLRRDTETVYAQATLRHIRTGSLDSAIEHMRQAEDAMTRGLPIRQVREFQRRAIVALKQTQTQLASGFVEEALPAEGQAGRVPDDQVASTADEAPAQYRELVSEYFKALSGQK